MSALGIEPGHLCCWASAQFDAVGEPDALADLVELLRGSQAQVDAVALAQQVEVREHVGRPGCSLRQRGRRSWRRYAASVTSVSGEAPNTPGSPAPSLRHLV